MIIEKEFKEKPESVFSDLMHKKFARSKSTLTRSSLLELSMNQSKVLGDDDLRNLYFGDFIRSKEEAQLRAYEEIADLNKLKQVLNYCIHRLSMYKLGFQRNFKNYLKIFNPK